MKKSEMKYDHTMFAVPSVVLLEIETAELHLIDKVMYGFGAPDAGFPIDEKKVETSGYIILGDL